MPDWYQKSMIALALSDAKAAAVYFPYVMRMEFGGQASIEWFVENPGTKESKQELKELLFPREKIAELYGHDAAKELYSHMQGVSIGYYADIARSRPDVPAYMAGTMDMMGDFKGSVAKLNQFTKSHDMPISLWMGKDDVQHVEGVEPDEVIVALTGLKIVDTSALEWPQIFELRKDEAAMRRLRNLRLALARDYTGRNKLEVQDALKKEYDEYQTAAREWGLSMFDAAFNAIVTKEHWVVSGASTLVAAMTGAPITFAAAAGLIASLGFGSLQVAKAMTNKTKLREVSPVGYFADLADLQKK